MFNIEKKASILRAVAAGGTLKKAGEAVGISAGQAVNNLSRLCREISLPYDLDAIRSNPDYLSKLDALINKPTAGLRDRLVDGLITALKLPNEGSLTPQYMSNLSAGDLHRHGITFTAISEIQDWLLDRGLSLKRIPPDSPEEIREAQRAIALLNALYFDTSKLEVQFDHLTGVEDDE